MKSHIYYAKTTTILFFYFVEEKIKIKKQQTLSMFYRNANADGVHDDNFVIYKSRFLLIGGKYLVFE